MRASTLLLVSLLAPPAAAQDRPSVERFAGEYGASISRGDLHWLLAHTDPTLIVHYGHELGFRSELQAEVAVQDRLAPKDRPKPDPTFRIALDRVAVIGPRAIFDMTLSRIDPRTKRRVPEQRHHGILVWRDGDWAFWRLMIGSIAPPETRR